MPPFVSCPSCQGLLPRGRESCPHCDFLPARIAQVAALGTAAVLGFSAFVACSNSVPVVEYGPCVQPDGALCGQGETDSSDVDHFAGDASNEAGHPTGDAGGEAGDDGGGEAGHPSGDAGGDADDAGAD